MPAWTEPLEWWALINRADVILAARRLAEDGGLLVLDGAAGYGHVQAGAMLATEMSRFGWQCFDVGREGPTDAVEVAFMALDELFPAAAGTVPISTQLAGFGRATVGRRFRVLLEEDGDARRCLICRFPDREAAFDRGSIEFLEGLASERLAIVLLCDGQTDWSEFDVDRVELEGFLMDHIELFLASCAQLAHCDPAEALSGFRELSDPDGRIIPLAAYGRAQSLAGETAGGN